MSIFPAISPTVLAIILLAVTGGMLFILVGLGINNPLFFRMGLRNMVRRPSQVAVLLCGLSLSAAVITATFGLSDSFTASAITYRLGKMGRVNESVSGPLTQANIDLVLSRLKQDTNVQAATTLGVYPRSPTVISTRTSFSVSNVDFYAVPPAFDQVYGPIVDTQGRPAHFADLTSNQVFINPTLAQSLNARTGDTVQLHFGGTVVSKTVSVILSNDVAVTTGEVVASATPEVIMSLSSAQRIDAQPPDAIAIRNVGSTTSQSNNRSSAVLATLRQVFPGTSTSLDAPHALGVTDFDVLRIHPLQPDVAVRTTGLLLINKLVFLSSAGQQFSWLPPLFTCLLVGAGMLLLVLLVILLTVERRAELGISRALGLQRSHLIQLFLFEGCGYGILASFIGTLLGIGTTALELVILSLQPLLSTGEANNATPISVINSGSLQLSISWQSIINAWCIGLLTTMLTMFVTAIWVSRTNIVTAIRDLDDVPAYDTPLRSLWKSLLAPPQDAYGKAVPETMARQRARRLDAIGALLWTLCMRGPLCLLVGGLLFFVGRSMGTNWLLQFAMVLLVAGGGLLAGWLLMLVNVSKSVARRLSLSCIGLGWLVVSLLGGNTFLALFQPVVSFIAPPSVQELLLSMILPVVGGVVLVITNADLVVTLVLVALRPIRALVPIRRISLIYPLTFRFRTGITVALLSLVTFLVLLLVTINLGAIQVAQAATNSGGYQLQVDVFGSQLNSYSDMNTALQNIQNHKVLQQDFAAVGLLRLMYDFPESGLPQPITLDLPGHASYNISRPPMVANDAFLATTTLPLFARASGFSSDRAVWDAVRTHTGDIVMQYDSQVAALPASNGFTPFTVELPDSSLSTAHYHRVTVVGLVPASVSWRVLLSEQTAGSIKQPPSIPFINSFLFLLRPGVSESQAAQQLNQVLDASSRGITISSLDQSSLNGVSAVFTLFLGSYLALGLLFGALAIGVITSRSVVERRQQIGMLRALGFSRTLISRSFLLESGFVISLGLFIGAALALWFALQVARATYHDFPLPILPIVLILLGSFLVSFVSTTIPAQQASRLPPAEALRYE